MRTFFSGAMYKVGFKEKVFPFKKRNNFLLCMRGLHRRRDGKRAYDFMVLRNNALWNRFYSEKIYHLFEDDFEMVAQAEKMDAAYRNKRGETFFVCRPPDPPQWSLQSVIRQSDKSTRAIARALAGKSKK